MDKKKLRKEFDKKVKALDEIGAVHCDFGYKLRIKRGFGSETFTVPDWGNIWKFIEKAYKEATKQEREAWLNFRCPHCNKPMSKHLK